MKVIIQIPRVLQQYSARKSELPVKGATVRSALDELKQSYPQLYQCICDETDSVRSHINLFVNNDIVRDRTNLDHRLQAGDVLSVFQAVSGG